MLRLAAKTHLRAPIVFPWRSISTYPSTSALPTSTPPSKYPTRGGQNLSARFQRLEKSVRGKGAYQRDIDVIASDRKENEPESGVRVRPARPEVNTFMGFVVPEEPKPPEPDECCMSGCAVCVQDLYAEALDEYKQAVDALRTSLTTLSVPEGRWPPSIRTSASAGQPPPKQNVTLDAFAELERRLQMKSQSASQSAEAPAAPALGFASQGPRRRRKPPVDVALLYEGLRWVIFSNR
ncbi:hypothetical protein PHLGIDRAFT_34249 [Phlebiopsis gigantea 11061_1 CR5-6]|uniref:Oxidoreductase-like domain-containing protein n=1 Tax=Phlebiopsis gigantea (strain 11061_1 CR5-6) TaxID=745531 RepID=A0A0C3NWF4_PHLG1|nr:hypothetical protein PHLGIDRAFT_34249 [Phlebiopsis gigantea 11061_1 CR5-6]